MSHTPGPWIPNRFDPSSPMTVVAVSGEWVCKVSSSGMWANQTPETEDANARLIAAAPDLLEALKACVCQCADYERMTDECAAVFRTARTAIAKATGQEARP